MTSITRLSDRRPSDAPGAEHISDDQWGRRMFRYRGVYQHKGKWYVAEFWTFGADDAEDIGERMGLRDIGQVIEEGTW